MSKYLDQDGLLYLWQKLKLLLANKVDTVAGKGLSSNDFSTEEKNKLAGIANDANNYSLPTASSTTKGGVKIGSGLTMTGEVLSANVQASYSLPTASSTTKGGVKIGSGLTMTGEVLSADVQSTNDFTTAEKTKLAGIAENANNYSLPTASSTTKGGVKVGSGLYISNDTLGVDVFDVLNTHIVVGGEAASNGGYAITLLTPDQSSQSGYTILDDVTIPAASSSASGMMTASDKAKLDAFGAASTYALKTDITSMYKHKGSVATTSALPASGNTAGDVYNVTATGMNYVWVESGGSGSWDALGEVFSIDSITNAEIDTILAA